jgi:hypothetical protein
VLVRHEWLQVLTRLAVGRYCRIDALSHHAHGLPAEALERLCYDHLHGRLPPRAMVDPNEYRKVHCYTEGTDKALRAHERSLHALFAAYSELDASHADGVARFELRRTRMSAGEWIMFLADVGLLEMRLVSVELSLQAFQSSRIRALADYSERSEMDLQQLHVEDFMEALVFIATVCALPTQTEIDEAACADAAELLHAMRDGAPTAYQSHVERRTRSIDDGPRQRAYVLVAHLIDLILHNVEAGCVADSSGWRADLAPARELGGSASLRFLSKPLSVEDVVRFRRQRACGAPLLHGKLKVDGFEVEAAMRRAESGIMEALRRVPAFEGLAPEQLETLREALSIAKFEDGERVFNQGDEGDAFYLITCGQCEALRFDPSVSVGERGGEERVGRLHPSDCFGERALLYNEPRAASIKAGPGCNLYAVFISRGDFERALGKPLEEFQRLRSGGPPAASVAATPVPAPAA